MNQIPAGKLSEQHPREQGLKLRRFDEVLFCQTLSEQHPREQGLKPIFPAIERHLLASFRATSKRTRIETLEPELILAIPPAFRATSKRTRIETLL